MGLSQHIIAVGIQEIICLVALIQIGPDIVLAAVCVRRPILDLNVWVQRHHTLITSIIGAQGIVIPHADRGITVAADKLIEIIHVVHESVIGDGAGIIAQALGFCPLLRIRLPMIQLLPPGSSGGTHNSRTPAQQLVAADVKFRTAQLPEQCSILFIQVLGEGDGLRVGNVNASGIAFLGSFRSGALHNRGFAVVMEVISDVRAILLVIFFHRVVHMARAVQGRNELHMIQLCNFGNLTQFVLRDIFSVILRHTAGRAIDAQGMIAASEPGIGLTLQAESHLLREMKIKRIHVRPRYFPDHIHDPFGGIVFPAAV